MADPSPPPPELPQEPDLTGRQLGDYRLIRRLGRGGMAEVYLAQQQSLKRQVAFKVLKGRLATDETYVRRFHHEAQAAAALVHANIVQIHEVGCIDGVHFIAQEYVRGQNLKELLLRQRTLDLPQAASVMRQVALALQKAAEAGIVHRDIKPENIMVSTAGEVKVADFGLARAAETADLGLTQVGVTMGTPLYMSPEQVEGRPLDPRSDLYSFGVTCFHMLAGRPPFEGETALAVAVQHLKSEPPLLESLRPDLPAPLCRIVARLLAKDPAARFEKASELLRELRGAISGSHDDADWRFVEARSGELRSGGNELLHEATRKLSLAMNPTLNPGAKSGLDSPSKPSLGLWRRLWKWGAIGGAFAIGGLLAWISSPRPLLEAAGDAPAIERFQTAQEQYNYAQWLPADQEWKIDQAYRAVWAYFPPDGKGNTYYGRLARRRLAERRLEAGEPAAAVELLQELASAENTAPEFQGFGLAGLAIAYDAIGNRDEAAKCLAKLSTLKQSLNKDGSFDRDILGLTMSEKIRQLEETYSRRQ